MRVDVFITEDQKSEIRESLGLKEGEPNKGVSAWIREAVQQRIDREKQQPCIYCREVFYCGVSPLKDENIPITHCPFCGRKL